MYLQPLVPSAEVLKTLTSQEKPPTHHHAGMKSLVRHENLEEN
jgi:hypothetical protein